MNREKSLVKNTAILTIGSFFPKITSIVTLPILTALLTKAEYGSYDLVATLVTLLIPIATLQIQSAAFRFLIESKNDKDKSSAIVTNIFSVILPVTVLVAVVMFFVFGNLSFASRILIALYFFFDSIELSLLQVVRGFSENKAYSIAAIILSVINMLLVLVLVLWLKGGLTGVMLSLVVAYAIATIYLLGVVHRYADIRLSYISYPLILEMLGYSWPMVFNNLSRWTLSMSDRLVITFFMGVEANAVYAVATKIPNLLATLQGTFSMAWQENASIVSKDKDSEQYYSKMFDAFFDFLSGLLGLLIASTPILFKILIKGSYDDAYKQMPILYLGMLFEGMAVYLGGIYVAKKKTKSIGITTIVAAALNLLIDFLLIKKIGITAGAISTLISYLFLLVYRMIDIRRIQKLDYKTFKLVFVVAIMGVMSILCSMRLLVTDIINVLIAIFVMLILNKDMIITVIKLAFTKIKGMSEK